MKGLNETIIYHKNGKPHSIYHTDDLNRYQDLYEVYNVEGMLITRGHWENDLQIGLWFWHQKKVGKVELNKIVRYYL